MKGNYQTNATHWKEAMQGCNFGCSGVACGELTQKAREALVFTSSAHLGQGDIPATSFLPPFPGNAGLKLGLDDFRSIFQLKQFHHFSWFIQPSQGMLGDIPLRKSPSGSHPPWLWADSSSLTISSAISNVKPTYPSAPSTERYFRFSVANSFSSVQDSGGFTKWEEGSMPQDGPCRRRESREDSFSLPKLPDTTSARKILGTNTELPASTSARVQPYFIFINMLW